MKKINTVMTAMQGLVINQHYLPEFRKVKDVEVLTKCPKCGREYEQFRGDDVPKYCTDCKTRLWVK